MQLNVTILRTKLAMPGNFFAYDGLVETKQLDRSTHSHFVIRGGKQYVSFAAATRSAQLNAMEIGWERYQATIAHDTAANAQLLTIAKSVYPELSPLAKWPSLWIEAPQLHESHAVRSATTDADR
jgi:hypothetical protein